MPYFSIARRSMPHAKGETVTFFASYPTNHRRRIDHARAAHNQTGAWAFTAGCPPLACGAAFRHQKMQETSNSTEGSVNGN